VPLDGARQGAPEAAAAAAARRAEESALAVRTRQRYEQVQALRAQGKGIKPIMRETGPAKETVRRFYRAATLDELLAKTRDGRPSLLDDHKTYLHQRWDQGCTNVRQLHGDRLDDWITAVEADDQPDLHPFARGIKHDHQAVLNGLTMPWSSGVVEGNVNRLKMLKRQTYGRASFELLRKRVLLCQ
jgi:transposase